MKHFSTKASLVLVATIFSVCLLTSTSVLAAAGGNGNGSSDSGGNPNDALAELAAEVAILQAEVIALDDAISGLEVNAVLADCANDGAGALQAAIDASPAAGAIINVVGVCDSTQIIGRTNLLIDGGTLGSGNGIGGTLNVDASRNIQLIGLTVDDVAAKHALVVANNSSVLLNGDFTVEGNTNVEVNSSLIQIAGTVNISGEVNASLSGQVVINNGFMGGFGLSRSSSLVVNASDASQSVSISGSLGAFSGSNVLAQAGDGSVSLTSIESMIVQRNSAALIAGANVQLNMPDILVRQNSVLDVLFVDEANWNVGTVSLRWGSGSRLFFNDEAPEQIIADCGDTVWTAWQISCPE